MNRPLFPDLPVLLVDDEPHILASFRTELRFCGISNIITCQDSRKVMPLLAEQEVGMLVLDLSMSHISGEELLPQVKHEYPEVPVVVVTGSQDIETAIACMKMGASDYLVKPIEEGRLEIVVRREMDIRDMRREIGTLRRRVFFPKLDHPEAFSAIVTNNPEMLSVFAYIESIAVSGEPVMITGETGVGKELVAGAVHRLSKRQGSFVRVNVAALDDLVFSDTLFGHAKGAFTGADQARPGMVERADGGTLFLDEIGELNHASQVKLLGLLQEREYLPLGKDKPRKTDARVVVASNLDLAARRREGEFRKDLYYRLNTHHIHLPPLRKRPEDLQILVDHFLDHTAARLGRKKPTPPKELIQLLATYHFPGNVRELRSMIFDAVSNHKAGVLSMATFKKHIRGIEINPQGDVSEPETETSLYSSLLRLPTIKGATKSLIEEAFKRADGNITVASRLLGISRPALSKRLKKKEEVLLEQWV